MDEKKKISFKDLLDISKALKNVNSLKESNQKTINNFSIDRRLMSLDKNILQGNKLLISEIKKLNKSYSENTIFKKKDPNAKLLNELEQSNLFAKENMKFQKNILGKIKDGSGILGNVLKFGFIGGLVGYLMFGNKKLLLDSIRDIGSTTANVGGGLISGLLNGDFSNVGDTVNELYKDLGEGLIGQILSGKNKPFNVLKGALETKGGLFQGLIWGDWDLFFKGIDDVKKNLTAGQMGVLGAILFGMPLARGMLSKLGGLAIKGLMTHPTIALGIATALATGSIITAVVKLSDVIISKHESKKRTEKFIKDSNDLIGEKYKEKGFSDEDIKTLQDINSTLLELSSKQYKKSDKEKLNDIILESTLRQKQQEIYEKYGWNKSPRRTWTQSQLNNIFVGSEDNLTELNNKSKNISFSSSIPMQSRSDATLNKVINDYGDIINDASKKYGVDPNLIAAVIAQESSGNVNAVSKAGAKGLMQMMDATALSVGVTSKDIYNPKSNIHGGTKYLSQLLSTYNGDVSKALWAYNAGPGRVNENIMPSETSKYIPEVLGNLKRIQELRSNDNMSSVRMPESKSKGNQKVDLSDNSISKLSEGIANEWMRKLPNQNGSGVSSSPIIVRK